MAQDRSLTVKLGAQLGDFQRGLQQATGSYGSFLSTMGGGKSILTAAAVAIAAVGAGLFTLAKRTAETGDRLQNMSRETGISIEQLSLLRFAAEQSDTTLEGLSTGIRRLTQNLFDAQRGLETYTVLFDAMGVSFADSEGTIRGTEEVLLDIADIFSQLEDGTTKAALAQKLFGRSGLELIPFLNEGRAGIEALTEKAREMGLEFSTESAQAASDFGDQLNELGNRSKALGEKIGNLLLPPANDLLDLLNDLAEGSLAAKDKLDDLAESKFFQTFKTEFKTAMESFGRFLAETSGFEVKEPPAKPQKPQPSSREQIVNEEQLGRQLDENREKQISLALSAKEREKAEKEAAKERAKAEKEKLAAIEKAQAQERTGAQIAAQALAEYLDVRLLYGQADEEYFQRYRAQLELQGKSTVEINALVAKRVLEIRENQTEKERQLVVTTNELMRKAAEGTADAFKGLWRKQEKDFDDVWKDSLDVFVDVMAEMVVQAVTTGKAISVSMAAASAGISFAVGLLGSLIGGSESRGPSELDRAERRLESSLETFLDAIKQSLDAFEKETATTLQNLTRQVSGVQTSFEDLFDLIAFIPRIASLVTGAGDISALERLQAEYRAVFDELGARFDELKIAIPEAVASFNPGELRALALTQIRELIVVNLDAVRQGLVEKFNLEKQLLEDISGIIQNQRNFVKDIDQSIIDVQRAFFTGEELFEAQKGDIQALTALVASAQGEDKLDLINELKSAYLASFETAKQIFAGDEDQLRAWQDFVIEGLEGLKIEGKTAYDRLIDIGLEELGLSRDRLMQLTHQTDLQEAIGVQIKNLAEASGKILKTLEAIAVADGGDLQRLARQLGIELRSVGIRIPGFQHGGIVPQDMIARLHRGELVVPKEKVPGVFGGNSFYFSLSLPNVRDIRDLSETQLVDLMQGKFFRVMERLGRFGDEIPMPARKPKSL